jgi:hypothetical protein
LINVCTGIEVPPVVAAPLIPEGGVQVQAIVEPVVVEVIVTAVVEVFEQMVWSGNENCTNGAGFTVMVNCFAGPVHVSPALVNLGVTVIVAITGLVPVLTAVKAKISPVPLPPSPIDVVLLFQLYDVPVPVKLTSVVCPPLQTTWLSG